jgi:hypothetical protein
MLYDLVHIILIFLEHELASNVWPEISQTKNTAVDYIRQILIITVLISVGNPASHAASVLVRAVLIFIFLYMLS